MPQLKPFSNIPATILDGIDNRWVDLCKAQPFFGDLDSESQQAIRQVWACSDFAANWCSRYPDRFVALWQSGQLTTIHDSDAFFARLHVLFADTVDEPLLLSRLREVRNTEMVRIAWRDLLGLADLEETLLALSDLADGLVDAAFQWLYTDHCKLSHGTPRDAEGNAQQLVVLGMGKLGGKELNFSSDIDLIFAYPEKGSTDGRRQLDNSQFFIKLGQRLINALHSQTADGFVYRVDMRLRPFGKSGALVTHFNAMEEYYQRHGREWERYALLKARVIAGDKAAGQELLQRLEGFVYRRYLDYGALESMREMKKLISIEAARKGQGDNLKTGPGGIREVEFTTQVFQLTYGGRDQHLRNPQLLPSLAYLGQRGLLPEAACTELRDGYHCLRRAENRLQMVADQQTHVLPEGDDERQRIALGMGHEDWDSFYAELNAHRDRVNHHFNQVFGESEESDRNPVETAMETLWLSLDGHDEADAHYLEAAGYQTPEETLKALQTFHDDRRIQALSEHGRQRLDRVMPPLLAITTDTEDPDATLQRLLDLLGNIARRTVYLSLLAEQPEVLKQLTRLCAASPWVGEYLAQHPILLDELISPESLYRPPDREGLRQTLQRQFERISTDDDEQILDQLRHFKHAQVFRVAAADIVGALPVMKVSDHLSWIAEITLEKVLASAWETMTRRYGTPRYQLDGKPHDALFIIVGYGKLGGFEMGYSSDLDIVFIHDSRGKAQYTNGDKSIDNATFFMRLASRMIMLLTTRTAAGDLYEVDTRLRPSGKSGLLVSSLEAFRKYQEKEAWTWEHQALIRARPVAGGDPLATAFGTLRRDILARPRDLVALQAEVRRMRDKMWTTHKVKKADFFDLKKSPGGITDIEFMVQYLVLAHARQHPELCRWTDNIRILVTLADVGIIEPETAEQLINAYRAMRDKIHRHNLQGKSARVPKNAFRDEQALVRQLWQQWLETPPAPA